MPNIIVNYSKRKGIIIMNNNTTTEKLDKTFKPHHFNTVKHATLLEAIEASGSTPYEILIAKNKYLHYAPIDPKTIEERDAALIWLGKNFKSSFMEFYRLAPAGFWRSTSTPEQLEAWDNLEETLDSINKNLYPNTALFWGRNTLGDNFHDFIVINAFVLCETVRWFTQLANELTRQQHEALSDALKRFKSVCPAENPLTAKWSLS